VNDLPIPSQIPQPQYGPDLNKAMKDAYVKTRNFLMVRRLTILRFAN
jgi:hypothetical protein